MTEGTGFYRAYEVAEMVGVSVVTVRRWVGYGWFEAIRLPNGELRFTPLQLKAFLDEHTLRAEGNGPVGAP